MSFAQLTYCESLRDIEACLKALSGKLYHSGIKEPVPRSTLAEANETRNFMPVLLKCLSKKPENFTLRPSLKGMVSIKAVIEMQSGNYPIIVIIEVLKISGLAYISIPLRLISSRKPDLSLFLSIRTGSILSSTCLLIFHRSGLM